MAVPLRRLTWVLLAICLASAAARGAGSSVQILGPVRVRIASASELPPFCRTAPTRRLFGCTAFTGQSLSCECEPVGDSWKLVATARIVPVIYFTETHTAEFHEWLHVGDIAKRIEAWIVALSDERFETEMKCRARAAAVSAPASVNRHLETFARQSNTWMQCARGGERIPPKEAVAREISSSTAEVAVAEQQ